MKCGFYVNPPGFPAETKLNSLQLSDAYIRLFHAVTDAQADIVSSVRRIAPDLAVTAPTFKHGPVGFYAAGYYCLEEHHANSSDVDFGGPPGLLMQTFLNFFMSHSPLSVGLGLNGGGYTGQAHLHVDKRNPPGRRWIETHLRPNTYQNRPGFLLTTVAPGDLFEATQYFNDDPNASVQIVAPKVVKGIWQSTLADAMRLYGVKDPDPNMIQILNETEAEDRSNSGSNWPLLLAVIGAAYGYENKNYTKLALYGAAGFAAGKVLEAARDSVRSVSGLLPGM